MNNIGYRIVPNTTPTKDVAPFLGLAVPAGSLACDNILAKMVESGTRMSEATAKYLLEAAYELLAETVAERNVRIAIGSVTVGPTIYGSFPSEDAAFDPKRNVLCVGATLSASLQSRVSATDPSFIGGEDGTSRVKMHTVYDLGTMERGAIRGTGRFRIAGIDLTVPDGEDESLELWSADGSAKVSDVTVVANDGGQQITAMLPASAKVGVGRYKLRLQSHGIDPSSRLATVTLAVTVVEPVTGEAAEDKADDVVDS